MSTSANPKVGNVGVLIRVFMGVDLTLATNIYLWITKPNHQYATRYTATIADERYLTYKTASASDLSVDGEYSVEPDLTLGDFSGRTERVYFTVDPNLA